MNSIQAISAGRAKTEIATPGRRFEVFQGAPGLTAIREDWKRVTRAMDKPPAYVDGSGTDTPSSLNSEHVMSVQYRVSMLRGLI